MAIHMKRFGSVCALALALTGCTGLKSPDERAATHDSGIAGMAGMAGTEAGSAGEGGSSGAGMSGQGAGMSDSGMDSGIDADVETDASMNDADVDNDTDGGDADSGRVGPIHGRVIDYNENAVPGVSVALDGVTVVTDDRGEFDFEGVPATFSISLSISYTDGGAFVLAGYLFVDLTRRDPTLQVYQGLARRSGYLTRTTAATFPVPGGQRLSWQLAGPYGSTAQDIASAAPRFTVYWNGPEQVDATAHAIRMLNSSPSNLPMSYLAHDEAPVTLSTTVDASHALDLSSAGPLPSSMVSGSVTGSNGGMRENHVYVRFNDDVAIQVVHDYGETDEYSYLVPSLADSSIAVAATRGQSDAPPYAVAYNDGVAADATNVDLDIPLAATLIAPAPGATNVDENTLFSWSGEDQVYMFTAKAESFAQYYYVITADKEAKLPILQTSEPGFRANTRYVWSVQTHRRFATVDEAAGADGYLDSYCYARLSGPRRGPGTHTWSAEHIFTSKP